ncbi:hypothetical protein ZEAMMB73_Zm00001d053662 [Zea mays]|uniref:Pectin lyase-like superfamily protein n=1 Tax=Zea mays TaxID=4577 RepID=A0A1D6QRA1_MAIZE|nr:hypothetical protein ZEAMMB73_Zm00001d053662 [Zea mays]
MAFISSAAMKAAVAALLVFAAVSPAARAVAAEAEAKAKAVGGAPSVPAGSLDIAQLGAKGDGKSDSTPMVLKAWKHACEATGQQKIVIPKGNYLTGALDLVGPCKSSIIIRLDGNLLGTGDLNAYKRNWIEIQNVDNLSINGHGTIDGVGSLGRYKDEKDVEDVKVTGCTLAGTTNGLRIKSYEDSKSSLKATKFLYQDVTMDNVSYPIIIDQKYCPNNICVKSGASKVAVNDVVFKNIHGTSNTPEAITLNCANNLPCQGVQLINVDIKYNRSDNKTMSVCKNAIGKSIGMAKELACV